jgi:heptosyltransferase-1
VNRSTLRTQQFQRVLLIKPSSVGDVIHTIPVLAKLRTRCPAARIDWVLTPPIAELIRHHPAVSNVLLFGRQEFAQLRRSSSAVVGLLKLLSVIRRTQYDLVIDLQGQFLSAALSLVSRAPVRIGFDRPRKAPWTLSARRLPRNAYRYGWTGAREGSWLAYSHRIPLPTLDVHAVDRYLWLRPLVGLDDGPPDFRIPLPAQAGARIDALLMQHGVARQPLAVLVPGTTWETKQWQVRGFAEVAQHLATTDRAVVLAGSENEPARCQAVAAACPTARDLCGQTTLTELAALLQRAAICVTNDSGAMHLAVALGTPVVSIFGPTDPVWVGPYGKERQVVRANLRCSPCYLRTLRRCAYGHACMLEVTSDMVIERVEQTLRAPCGEDEYRVARAD